MTPGSPQCVVIAGPNGAGKSSAAPQLLRDTVGVGAFVNADVIAQGLAGFAPEAVAMEAGRIMLHRLDELIVGRSNFAFETTLSGKTVERAINRALELGYQVHLYYLWLASADLAVARVRQRVALGGHNVPEAVVRRRYRRSLAHMATYLTGGVTSWRWYDGGANGSLPMIGNGGHSFLYGGGMTKRTTQEIAEILRDGDAIDEAFASAYRETVMRHRRLGVPLVVWQNGQVVEVPADQVELAPAHTDEKTT